MRKLKKETCKDRKLIFEWILAVMVAILLLITFHYIDLKSLTIWTTNLWDVIAKGDITQYFAYTAENVYNAPHQYVSGTLYSLIPWAIWNLPIWIAQYFFDKPILKNSIMLIWSTLFLVVCLIGVIFLVKKIMTRLAKDKEMSKIATFLTFSSIWIYVGVFYAGQNDIMICLLGLASMYALMKKNTKLFLLIGSFAVSVKYFFFIPFIALILLTEKDTYKIVLKILIGALPTIVFNLVCSWMPMFVESSKSGPTDNMFAALFKGSILGFAEVNISLFAVGVIIVLFLSYIAKPKEEERDKFIIYITTISFIPLLMFTKIQFYRIILIIPFLIISILQNKKMFKLNLILLNIFEIMSLISVLCTSRNLFYPKKGSIGILPKILGLNNKEAMSLGQKIKEIFPSIQQVLPAFATISIVSIIILAVINYPRFKERYIENKEEKYERWLLWIRPVATLTCTIGMYYLMK